MKVNLILRGKVQPAVQLVGWERIPNSTDIWMVDTDCKLEDTNRTICGLLENTGKDIGSMLEPVLFVRLLEGPMLEPLTITNETIELIARYGITIELLCG